MTALERIVPSLYHSEQEKALIHVLYSGNQINHALGKVTREYRLKAVHFHILQLLKEGDGIPIGFNSLRERLIDRTPLAVKHFDRLTEMGYIHRFDHTDKGTVSFRITPKGLEVTADMERKSQTMLDPIGNRLNSGEARTLSYILDKLMG